LGRSVGAPGADGAGAKEGGGVRINAIRAASLVWIIDCMSVNSSVASSIVIWRLRRRPTRYA